MISIVIPARCFKQGRLGAFTDALDKLEEQYGAVFTDEDVNELTKELKKYGAEVDYQKREMKLDFYNIPGFGNNLRISFDNGGFSLFRIVNNEG